METNTSAVEDVVSLTYNPLLATTVAHRFINMGKHTPNQERLTVLSKAPLGHLISGFFNQIGCDLFEGDMDTRPFSGISSSGAIIEDMKQANQIVSVLVRSTNHRIFPASDLAQSVFSLETFTPSISPTGEIYRHPDTMDFQGQDLPVFLFTLKHGESFEATIGTAAIILQLYYGVIDSIYMGFQQFLAQLSPKTHH